MATGGLTENYRCGYCYQKYQHMTNPKELPCHHVFCITCLEADFRENRNTCCPACQTVHQSLNFDELPSALLDGVSVEVPQTTLTCDRKGCNGKFAISYCVDCELKFCETHHRKHSDYFDEDHSSVSIQVFEQSPELYKKPVCEDHQLVLKRVCQKCYKLICIDCDVNATDCDEDVDGDHAFCLSADMNKEFTSYYDTVLESVSSKLTDLCKLEKKIWSNLDDEEEECKKQISEIERIRDEQLEVITEESEALKEKVYEYRREITNKVEVFNSELLAKKESLEALQIKVQKLLKNRQTTEMIIQRKQTTAELDGNSELGDCEADSRHHITTVGPAAHLNAHFAKVPTSLTLQSVHDTYGTCYSAAFREDGSLLLGTHNGIKFLEMSSSEIKSYRGSDNEQILSATEHGRCIYLSVHDSVHSVHNVGTRRFVFSMCLPDIELRQQLFDLETTSNMARPLAVSDKHIAVRNTAHGDLIIFNLVTESTLECQTDGVVRGYCFLTDGHLVVVSNGTTLTKYVLDDGGLRIIWKRDNIFKSGNQICVDSKGLMYVSTLREKVIYVISPTGEKLAELHHEKLPKGTGRMSIKDDILAVPGWSDNNVILFKLNR